MIGNYYMTDGETVEKIQREEISLVDLIYDENNNTNEESSLDIDKAWHAIHFTLTDGMEERKDILSNVVFGGRPINNEDIGYGPAILLTVEEVQEVHQEIKDISQNDFRDKFSMQKMVENDVYPLMDDENEEGFFSYVWSYFEEVKTFFAKAAAKDNCVLFYIS